MGLGTRTTATRRVISLFDEVMAHIPADKRARYAMSRDLADLGDLSALPVRPVVFTLSPLLTATEALADNDHACVQFHLRAVEGAPPEWKFQLIENVNGRPHVADETMEAIPRNVVEELAQVIRELANGDTIPFSSPGGWQAWHVRATAMEAARRAASPKANDHVASTENSP